MLEKGKELFGFKKESEISSFNVHGKIGEGTFSEVFLVNRKGEDDVSCMKRISKYHCQEHG